MPTVKAGVTECRSLAHRLSLLRKVLRPPAWGHADYHGDTPVASLADATAVEIAASVVSGRTTCEAVARAHLARIEQREPEVLAFQYLNPDQVIDRARALDRSGARGPLAGVPFGIKDIIDTCDMP